MNLAIVKFCSEEVDRQGRGAIQVWNMVEAWDYVMRQNASRKQLPTTAVIQECGHLIEPTKNDGGWRKCGVRVGSYVAPVAKEVPSLMRKYAATLSGISPAEAYLALMKIHPLLDGNGRLGKIVFNWLNGTLDSPVMPPRFFDCVNY
jgi:hypothetical protein